MDIFITKIHRSNNKKLADELYLPCKQVLKDCDFARYTPTTSVMMKQEFEKAKEVITKIDKYL